MLGASARCAALARHVAGTSRRSRGLLAPGPARAAATGTEPEPGTLAIGDVSVRVRTPACPELVPWGFHSSDDTVPADVLEHLRWIMQKDALGQDMFLVGPPSPLKRWLALRYCELTQREVDVVSISQDTTEADLKQRREIVGGTAVFADQAPVRAAIAGRVLLLEGIEKAERNVLPTLNNLLENREMSLDDGRFLMSARAYDALLAEGRSKAELDERRIVRVHPDFRVIATGLPVPPFEGRTLDPPLRSRFQARSIPPPSPDALVTMCAETAPSLPPSDRTRLVSIAEAFRAVEEQGGAASGRLPHLAPTSLLHVARAAQAFPHVPLGALIERVYPLCHPEMRLPPAMAEHRESARLVAGKFGAALEGSAAPPRVAYSLAAVEGVPLTEQGGAPSFQADLLFHAEGSTEPLRRRVAAGALGARPVPEAAPDGQGPLGGHAPCPTHDALLAAVMQDHALDRHMCLIGGKGTGKSAIARAFAHALGYETELFSLFKDMTARDLLQRRATDHAGNTTWEHSPLVTAALHGRLAILDGLHRMPTDTISVLQRLLQDSEVDLFDGTRLVSWPRYLQLVRELGDDARLVSTGRPAGAVDDSPDGRLARSLGAAPGVVEVASSGRRLAGVHPAFRALALADPPSAEHRWLQSETLPLLSYHIVPGLPSGEARAVLGSRFPRAPAEVLDAMVRFQELVESQVQSGAADGVLTQAHTLSTRHLIRLARLASAYPEACRRDLPDHLHDALLSQFLPPAARQLLDDAMVDAGVHRLRREAGASSSSAQYGGGELPPPSLEDGGRVLRIGDVSMPVHTPANPELVPRPLFYDNPRHTALMRAVLEDMAAGERHLLLIGNQGVGKNKIADRLLQLLGREREYIQLHRDTTVQTLTLAPALRDGRVVWEDSPLVRAVTQGRTLVVDEADKAPLEVVCVLKNLVEDGEMRLADGRRLLDPRLLGQRDVDGAAGRDPVVPIHPDFRMWVLSNRPGFPFLGNDFFKECGDVFASHTIENPDTASELAMLRAYGPEVEEEVLRRLSAAFQDLRGLAHAGTLSYPYSTRELVSIVKHLQHFPDDGVVGTLENVLAFDAYDKDLRETLSEVFTRHGLPLPPAPRPEARRVSVELARERELPKEVVTEELQWSAAGVEEVPVTSQPLQQRRWPQDPPTRGVYSLQPSRIESFTEERHHLRCPSMRGGSRVLGVASLPAGDSVHVLVSQPLGIHSFASLSARDEVSGSVEREHMFHDFSYGGLAWHAYTQGALPTVTALPSLGELFVHVPGLSFGLSLDPAEGGAFTAVELPTPPGRRKGGFRSMFSGGGESGRPRVVDALAGDGTLLLFQEGGSELTVLDLAQRVSHAASLDVGDRGGLARLDVASADTWIARCVDGSALHLTAERGRESLRLSSSPIASRKAPDTEALQVPHAPLSSSMPTARGGGDASAPATFAHPLCHLQRLVPEGSHTAHAAVHSSVRDVSAAGGGDGLEPKAALLSLRAGREGHDCIVHGWQARGATGGEEVAAGEPSTALEIVEPGRGIVRLLPFLRQGAEQGGAPLVGACALASGELLTAQADGTLRVWEVEGEAVRRELELWRRMYGVVDTAEGRAGLSLARGDGTSSPRTGTDGPKHGKEDAQNAPHVGGNTWAGGTGGSDTAGLGGRGGPYRLDKGHTVHQISEAEKAQVSEEARAQARAMAKEALQAKLAEIGMSSREHEAYNRFYERISREVGQLRMVLEQAESRARERTWLRNQTSGELDDGKLVDGVTGERLIYKRRGEEEPTPGALPSKPKVLRFVMDVSGSMYRFNGQDGRLDRMLESAMLIMEGLHGFDHKYKWSMVGHSGDSPEIPFVDYNAPPQTRKQRLEVLERMVAHTQYCMSGDHTLEGAEAAVREVTEHDADERLVFVLSDANLRRYGIPPQRLGKAITRDRRVRAYAIFIASLADEAERVARAMPAGRGFACFDTSKIPGLFRQIFAQQVV